jgi:hypothetical protein
MKTTHQNRPMPNLNNFESWMVKDLQSVFKFGDQNKT